jgi:MoxR-like ATPase
MPFTKMNTHALPPRHWALVGLPGSGKSTLAAAMAAPLLIVDAAGALWARFAEVAHLVAGDVLSLSDQPADRF